MQNKNQKSIQIQQFNPATTHQKLEALLKNNDDTIKVALQTRSFLNQVNAMLIKLGSILPQVYSLTGWVAGGKYVLYMSIHCLYRNKPQHVIDVFTSEAMDLLGLPADHPVTKHVEGREVTAKFDTGPVSVNLSTYGDTGCTVTYVTETYEKVVYSCK